MFLRSNTKKRAAKADGKPQGDIQLTCLESLIRTPVKKVDESIQTQCNVRDICCQTMTPKLSESSAPQGDRFKTPDRRMLEPSFVSTCVQTNLTHAQNERVSRLFRTPEIFTPKMTMRSPILPHCNKDAAEVIGRDRDRNLRLLQISHQKLSEMYRDVLPAQIKQRATERQVDCFNLTMFSYDLQYMYNKYAHSVTSVGDVEAVKF
jgi:hypothetical protein